MDLQQAETLTIIRLVRPVSTFWDNSSAGNTFQDPARPIKNKTKNKKTADSLISYLNMNRACFWVFLARVGQKITNV